MNRQVILYLFCFFPLVGTIAYAHSGLSGKVLTEEGEPIPGATVRIANTVIGTITNRAGEFTLKKLPHGRIELIVTAVGHASQQRGLFIDDKAHDSTLAEQIFYMQPATLSTGEIVVSATRSEKMYEDVPVKISVINSRVFEATSSISLRDGLRFQPGLRVEANCQNCGYSQVRMNGLQGQYSQILIDSRPVFTALNSLYGLEQLPTAMIDRVEVIRGGGSALYGGNAIAGVVNIITREAQENTVEASVTQGFIDGKIPDRAVRLATSMVADDQNTGIHLFGMFRDRQAWDMNGDGFTESSFIRSNAFGARAYYTPNYYGKISLEFHSLMDERRGGDQINRPPHEVEMAEDLAYTTIGGSATYEQFFNSQKDKVSLYASVSLTDRANYTGVGMDPNGYGTTNSRVIVSGVQYAHTFADFMLGSAIVTGGYELSSEDVQNIALGYRTSLNQSVQLGGLYGQVDWLLNDQVNLLLGARASHHTMIENLILTPRATMLYKPIDELSLRGSFSTGFRAPQAYDEDLHAALRGGARQIIMLDPALKEERSIGYSFAADYAATAADIPFSLSLEYFDTQLYNVFINEDAGRDEQGNILMIKRNGEGAAVRGATVELQAQVASAVQLQGSLTLQRSLYDVPVQWSEGNPEAETEPQYSRSIFRMPDVYGYMTAFVQLTRSLEFDLTAVYTGRMYVPHKAGYINRDVLIHTPDFFEWNTRLSYQLMEQPVIAVDLGVYNIFNAFQQDFDLGPDRDTDYIYGPIRPRTLLFGIKTTL